MTGYRPGRDDTRFGKLERELAANWALEAFEPQLAASADLNERYAGRWHCWFVAQGTDTVEWLARPAGQGEPLLSAPTAAELAVMIDEASR
ncbi:MAG TPA: hypothetical protein VG123_20985 [Streptosporangiaceae bacterium]|nr:hypothetical protein [Streptosporangiaceae bacterium]